jgi:hypothetical protein
LAKNREHDRLLHQSAKEILKPAGFRQSGRSRLYLSDEGLWSCVIEFQPHGHAVGSFLNVSAHWLWSNQDYISFDFYNRIGTFIEFIDTNQFAEAAQKLAQTGLVEASKLRALFRSADDIGNVLLEIENDKIHKGCWNAYNAAIALGFCEKIDVARSMFESILAAGIQNDWQQLRSDDAQFLSALLSRPQDFRSEIMRRIAVTRTRLKLSEK